MPMPSDLPPMGEKITGYSPLPQVNRVPTGISGIDILLLGGFKPKSTILLIGPPGSEKITMALQFVAAALDEDEPVIYTTLDKSPADLENTASKFGWYLAEHVNKELVFIDCYSWTLGAGVSTGRSDIQVQGPSALNDLSISLSQSLQKLSSLGGDPRIILHSLSTLLLYNNPETIFKFIQVTGSRLKSAGATTLFILESGMHDEKIVSTIKHLVDEVVELRAEGGKLSIRMAQGGIPSWVPIKSTPTGIELI